MYLKRWILTKGKSQRVWNGELKVLNFKKPGPVPVEYKKKFNQIKRIQFQRLSSKIIKNQIKRIQFQTSQYSKTTLNKKEPFPNLYPVEMSPLQLQYKMSWPHIYESEENHQVNPNKQPTTFNERLRWIIIKCCVHIRNVLKTKTPMSKSNELITTLSGTKTKRAEIDLNACADWSLGQKHQHYMYQLKIKHKIGN